MLGCIISWLFFTPKCGTKENKVNSHPLGLGKKEHRNERSLSALSYIPKHSYTVSLSDVLSHPISTMNRAKKKRKTITLFALFSAESGSEKKQVSLHAYRCYDSYYFFFPKRKDRCQLIHPFSPRAKLCP